MARIMLIGIAALLVAMYTPAILLDPVSETASEEFVLIVREDGEKPQNGVTMIDLKTENGVLTISLEDYLIGVVLSEMPASFELEALKAQAVAARTFALRQLNSAKHSDCDLCNKSTCCQAWNDKETFKNKLGNSFQEIWRRGERAVKETRGDVITYHNALIDAVYFSCSGGRTEDAVAVWGNEIPYLRSVESPGEENARVFVSEVRISAEEFSAAMKQWNSNIVLSDDITQWLGNIERTSGDGVKCIEIGGKFVTGTEMRAIFDLRSTNFTISLNDREFIFSVLGYGHRVGMSQYGANAMAKDGKTYDEIIKSYYSGVSIKNHRELSSR